ncbi:MAG: hypothetical protein JEZ09_00505 [Salinivirgaceae bacterium]|nr:hypothetical protein [Salinivirgaceae bacterium]
MRIIYILTIFAFSLMVFQSCDKSELEIQVTEGGLIELKNPSISYVVGNTGPYTSSIRVYSGEEKITKVEVYKTFYTVRKDTLIETVVKEDTTVYDTSIVDAILTSNSVLFQTFNLNESENVIINFDFTFNEIRDGLTMKSEELTFVTENDYVYKKGYTAYDVGQVLPTSDGDLTIGDYWSLVYKSTVDGRVTELNKATKVAVATRFAGTYIVAEGIYWHPDYYPVEYQTDYILGETVYIESVDAKTYVWKDWWDIQTLYFQIDGDYHVTVLDEWKGEVLLLNGLTIGTCENGQVVPHLPCDTYNIAIAADDGKDQIKICFAYMGASGPREFIHTLVRQ